MDDKNSCENTLYIEVSGAGLSEVDGLYVPSTEPPKESESGTLSSPGFWNGKLAWDRADGKSARSPAISYSNSYKSWRICRLDGHLAYDNTCDDDLPPVETEWHVYKQGLAPAPEVVIHHFDPRLPCPEFNVLFVTGGPGSGKGTMCALAQEQLGWLHLSTGELLRAELAANGAKANVIQEYIDRGELVPDEMIVGLVKEEIEQQIRTTGKRNFLLDGFPRSLTNMEGWYEKFGQETQLPTMIYLECPYEELEKRILARAEYSGRSDDNVKTMKLRFDTYKEKTLPTVMFFKSKNKCIEIDTSADRLSVYEQFSAQLSEFTELRYQNVALSEKAEILLGIRRYPD